MSCNLTESHTHTHTHTIEKHETYQVWRRSMENVACLFKNEAVDIIKKDFKKNLLSSEIFHGRNIHYSQI